MRYIAKFNNGAWKVFDTVQYTDVDVARGSQEPVFLLQREANEIVDRLNARTGRQ